MNKFVVFLSTCITKRNILLFTFWFIEHCLKILSRYLDNPKMKESKGVNRGIGIGNKTSVPFVPRKESLKQNTPKSPLSTRNPESGCYRAIEVTKEVVLENEKSFSSVKFKKQIKPNVSFPLLKENVFPSEEENDVNEVAWYLLRQSRDMVSSGENPQNALDLAIRAMESFEKCSNKRPNNLELVTCLHVVGALYCKLEKFNEAIPILERATEIPTIDQGQNHALAKFAGCMQLGDTYAMIGEMEKSILYYTAGLEIQRQVLGEKDPQFGDTCRYVADAHVQMLQFDEAEKLCKLALDTHREKGSSPSLQEAADRRLMGIIYESKGNYKVAFEHYVLAGMAISANGHENHPLAASVFVRLAELYNKTGKYKESRSYCEHALCIYYNKPLHGFSSEEVASGLIDVSAIYQSMTEFELALKVLQKAVLVYENGVPGQQSTVAGIEAQMGALHYLMGSYSDSYNSFKNAVLKFREIGEKKYEVLGIVLNQMGLACVQLYAINEAAELFQESKNILEKEYGPCHNETLAVYSNLAGTYDAMGRSSDAIEILEYIVGMREQKLGTANPDGDDEKRRLAELLKEAGRVRKRKSRSLEALLEVNYDNVDEDEEEVKDL